MAGTTEDHDQRFKSLLKEFLPEFFELFFPEWAARFDFSRVEWLDKEMLSDPPAGERRVLDLVAKLAIRDETTKKQGKSRGKPKQWVVLIHVEIESGKRVATFRQRMFRYYVHLRNTYDLPVLPVTLYQNVGLEGIGTDEYQEKFGELEVVHFRFLYVGLPRLDAVEYLEKDNWLGVALSALMKAPEGRRPWLKAEALRRLAGSSENDQRRFLLSECVQAYLRLADTEEQEFEQLLESETYEEVATMASTWFEQGIEQGIEEGRLMGRDVGRDEGRRDTLVVVLEERFGRLKAKTRKRIVELPADEVQRLVRQAVSAESLKDLGLDD